MRRLLFIITMLTAITPAAKASIPATAQTVDSLRTELSESRTAADSVPILCNLYDILPRDASSAIGDTLYHTAMRAGDQRTALDIIRNQANRFKRNSAELEKLTQWALACSDGNDRRETLTFIRMMDNLRSTRYGDSVERSNMLQKYMTELQNTTEDDLYNHIVLTHGICMLLSDDPRGEILVAYMDSLSKLVKKLPSTSYAIRNAFNVHAAAIFAVSHPDKSMEADRTVLKGIANLEKYYNENGRIYRNYNAAYYTIYTRFLSNFTALDSTKVEEYYRMAMDMVKKDEAISQTYNNVPLPDIYHAMFHKDYRRALPLLSKTVDNPDIAPRRLQMLRYIIECSEALGYKETLLNATRQYADALQKEIDERSSKNYRELQTAYAIYEMKHDIDSLETEKRESKASMQRIIIGISFFAVIMLVIFMVFLFRQYRKNRLLAHNLSESNKRLLAEGENLRKSKAELIRARDQAQKANNLKSDFIKNMSYEVKIPLQAINEYSHLIADCVANSSLPSSADGMTSQSAKHLSRFADLLELNSELLSTIINDVLRLSEIESTSLPIQAQVVNLKTLCDATIASVKHRVKPGVTLTLAPEAERIDLFTDPSRLQQILNNLLINATKFTSSGSIVLSYHMDSDDKNVIFTVTDTGIGINPENKEKIFERFVKLDNDSQGIGLGLTISRLLARHLGGDLYLDTSYTSGARFSLSLPKK